MINKRVFDMDLFIDDIRRRGGTLQNAIDNSEWAEGCDGQRCQYIEDGSILGLMDKDGVKYEVLEKWTRLA